jgi:putative nucleotidyltransferase with HDIG domain
MGTLPIAPHGRSAARPLRAGVGIALQGAVVSAALFYLRRSVERVRGEAARDASVRSLLRAVEVKDGYTRAHSERVAYAAVLMARQLEMPKGRVTLLRYAALLHDVGKLGVPTRLLTKSGRLDADERETIQRHPQCGADLVRDLGFLGEGREGILHHHERMDGRGYPAGLKGDEIPEFARVIAVADAFDAMTSTRSYRRSRPVEAALAELRRCSGEQFDPRMVDALDIALRRFGWPLAEPAPVPRRPPRATDRPCGIAPAEGAMPGEAGLAVPRFAAGGGCHDVPEDLHSVAGPMPAERDLRP